MGRKALLLLTLMAALVMVSGTALAAITYTTSKRVSLKLNKPNYVGTALTRLASNAVGPALTLETDSTDLSATPLKLDTETNSQAPMSVDSSIKVSGLNADQLDGKDESAFLGETEKAADSDLLDGRNSSDFASAYKSTVVVSPVGTATQNGTALKNALAGITNASATNPYLLKIEPGVYDLGAAPGLQMKSWVDIEGSGEGITTLTSTGSQTFQTGTVVGAANSELRFVTVKNTGGSSYAIAVYYSTGGPSRLTHVSAVASGGTSSNVGVRIDSGAATLSEATLTASGNSQNLGVFVGGAATLSQVSATGSGGSENYGVGANSINNVEVRDSHIVGSTNTLRDFGSPGVILVGASQLVGGATSGVGACAGVYDENYAFFASTCP